MEEAHRMAEEMKELFPRGVTVYGSKPEGDPAEGAMYAEPDGQVMVFVDGMWKKLIVTPPAPMPMPYSWDPRPGGTRPSEAEKRDMERTAEDADNTELLEVLLCPECEMELGSRACGPRHAYLADNPLDHRLIRPLLERHGLL